MASPQFRFLRLPAVEDRCGIKCTSVYQSVKHELLPPPIKLTERTSVWLEHEIDMVIRARAAGMSEDEIRTLVRRLIAQRQQYRVPLEPAAA